MLICLPLNARADWRRFDPERLERAGSFEP